VDRGCRDAREAVGGFVEFRNCVGLLAGAQLLGSGGGGWQGGGCTFGPDAPGARGFGGMEEGGESAEEREGV
jgi:hypothetical protein